MLKGTVKHFDENTGSGVIRADDGREVPVRYPDLAGEGWRTLDSGMRVTFILSGPHPEAKACEVTVLGEAE